MRLISHLINEKNWKIRDIKELFESHPKVQAFVYASLLKEGEENKREMDKMKLRARG